MGQLDDLRTKMIFLGLSEAQLQLVGSILRVQSYRRGAEIVSVGDVDDALYVVQRGAVELRIPLQPTGERTVSVFEKGSYVDEAYAGDFFGEFALVDLVPWKGRVVARERTVLWEFKRDDLYALFAKDQDLQIGVILNISRMLCRRLRLRNRQL